MSLSSSQAKTILSNLGFRVDNDARLRQAVRDFQGGWNLGPWLKIDGKVGPKTSAALSLSELRRRRGLSTASSHFSFKEFTCHCGGRYAACRRIAGEGRPGHARHVLRALIQSLEILRASQYPHGMSIVSGYRCDGHNKDVDGASSSQHRWGAAADCAPVASMNSVKALSRFAGIGFQGSSGKVRHVDRRDFSGVNLTGGSVKKPTTWRYS